MGALASSNCDTTIAGLLPVYALCSATEGKSKNAIDIVAASTRYLETFLTSHGASADVRQISHLEIRAFILNLKQKRCFEDHPLNRTQERPLSGHTVNTYLRSIRIFFSWLVNEGILEHSPFDRVKIPDPPRKVIPTFSETQIRQLLATIDTATPGLSRLHHDLALAGYRPARFGTNRALPFQRFP